MLLRLSIVAIGLATLAAPSQAMVDETNSDQAVAAETKTDAPEDKIICRGRREARTGSNMRPGRECRTASEWKEREVAAKRELQRLRDKAQTPGMGEGR